MLEYLIVSPLQFSYCDLERLARRGEEYLDWARKNFPLLKEKWLSLDYTFRSHNPLNSNFEKIVRDFNIAKIKAAVKTHSDTLHHATYKGFNLVGWVVVYVNIKTLDWLNENFSKFSPFSLEMIAERGAVYSSWVEEEHQKIKIAEAREKRREGRGVIRSSNPKYQTYFTAHHTLFSFDLPNIREEENDELLSAPPQVSP